MRADRRDFLRLMSGIAAVPVGTALNRTPVCQDSSLPLAHSGVPDVSRIREDFPALHQKINGQPLIYLDSAATAHRPRAVIDATSHFYEVENANPSASLHALARQASELYEGARRTIARFVRAHSCDEIVFTKGTTEAINLVAAAWGPALVRSGDEILLTQAEHYSNLLPWRFLAERTGAHLHVLDVDDAGKPRLEQLDALLSPRTKLVAVTHVSNVLGFINPVAEICERAHRTGALVLVDAAQSVPHIPVSVQELGCDFLAFSSHKMLGPMGIGILWVRGELFETPAVYQTGSNMAHELKSFESTVPFASRSHRFEAGTPNVAGAVGFAAAVEYLESLGRAGLAKHELELTSYALESLVRIPGLRIIGPTEPDGRVSVFSFVIKNISPLELARSLDQRGIAIRAGDLAALPLLRRFAVDSAARASCYIYTSRSEIDALVSALRDLARLPGS